MTGPPDFWILGQYRRWRSDAGPLARGGEPDGLNAGRPHRVFK